MKNKIYTLLIVFLSLSSFAGYAQDIRFIEGLVEETINGRREPSIGINVSISNEQNRTLTGIVTGIDGKYALRIPENQGKLKIVFSFIGMKTQTFQYTGQRVLNVVMAEETQVLQDFVVTAKRVESELGITTREQTFSSQKIKLDAVMETLPVTSIEEALQGRIAGLDILTGGDPGSRSSIRIRGTATLNSNVDPLIVINGVPYSTDIDDAFDFNTANDEDFAAMLNLNPNDIEAIEVLKDAASTSIYGTKGANGVLLITTKKGARGKTNFSISSKTNVKIEPKPMEVLSGNQYVAFIQDAIWNSAKARGLSTRPELLELLFNTPEINYNPGWRYFNEYNADTDWLSYVKRNAISTDNSFSMSGGGEKATYRFSMSYLDEGGTTIGTGLNRLTSNLMLTYYFSDKLRVESDFSYSSSDKSDNWTTSVRSEALRKMPNKSPYWMTVDGDGNLVQSDNYFTRQNAEEFQGAFSASGSSAKNFHPIIMANESFNNTKLQEERMVVRLMYNIMPGFDYSGYVSMRFSTNENRKYLPQAATDVSSESAYNNLSTNSFANSLALLTENKLIFRKNWDDSKHTLVTTGIWRTEQSTNSDYVTEIYAAPTAGMSDPVAGGAVQKIASGDSEGRALSGIASAAYTLMNRYVLSGTLNYEGRSSLGKDRRWGAFPSWGARWHVNEESFMQNTAWLKWLNELSLRYSYGQSGQAPRGTAPYVGTYSAVGQYVSSHSVAPATMQLNKLKWETSSEHNIGVDASLFDSKLNITFDYYQKYTKDLLQYKISIPNTTGYEEMAVFNSGELSNKGIEFRFDYRIFENKQWRVASWFNVSRNINKIEVLPDNLQQETYTTLSNGTYAQKIVTGTPTGSFFGFKYLGVYQSAADTYARDENGDIMYNLEGNPMVMRIGNDNNAILSFPGDAKYEDVNHDGIINTKDITYIGNCMPVVFGGMGASATYKNLSLNINMHYRLGQKIINQARMNSESMSGSDNQSKTVLRRWRNSGDNTDIPRALWGYGYNWLGSDRFVDDASFLRLQSISLNYRFPKRICEMLHLNALSTFFTVYDAFTFTAYNGQDPEVTLPKSVTDLAKDNAQTPRSARYAIGINLSF